MSSKPHNDCVRHTACLIILQNNCMLWQSRMETVCGMNGKDAMAHTAVHTSDQHKLTCW